MERDSGKIGKEDGSIRSGSGYFNIQKGGVEEWNDVSSLSELSPDLRQRALLTGVRSDEELRCGTYFQVDHSVIFENVKREFEGKVEILSTREAMKRYDWVKDYWWNAVPVDSDKYTAKAELEWDNGYFLRVLPGQKVAFPMQACLFMSQEGISQNVHNLIIAEEGSDVQIITGCVSPGERRASHRGKRVLCEEKRKSHLYHDTQVVSRS